MPGAWSVLFQEETMPVFEAAAEAKDEPLTLPIPTRDGRIVPFSIPPLMAGDVPKLAGVARSVRMHFAGMGDRVPEETNAELDAMTEQQYLELVLSGPVFAAMIEQGVGGKMMLNAAVTAQTWHLDGLERARITWDRLARGVDPTMPTRPATTGNNGSRTSKSSPRSSKTARKSNRKRRRVGESSK
jgi:hypothetical protein